MSMLVPLHMAKAHLKIPLEDVAWDDDIQLKVEQATAIILERCNSTAYWRAITPTWTDETTVPSSVQTAILLLLTHLYENRGNDMKTDAMLWDALNRFLALSKDPVIA